MATVDREIFTRKNIRVLNFRVVLFLSPRHTGSVASFLLFDVDNFRRRRVLTKNSRSTVFTLLSEGVLKFRDSVFLDSIRTVF